MLSQIPKGVAHEPFQCAFVRGLIHDLRMIIPRRCSQIHKSIIRRMENHKSDWERVKPEKLGEGGQSDVYLVRTPERTKQRARSLQFLRSNPLPSMIVTSAD